MAYHRMVHPDGEAASAAGAAAAGALYVLSTQATMSAEEVAAAAPGAVRWFQVYVVRDRGWTADLVARAAAAGYRALVLTVDVPLLGNRLRDLRNGFRLPTGLKPANAPPVGAARQRELDVDVLAQAGQFDPALTPDVVAWLADRSGLPVVVKGSCAPTTRSPAWTPAPPGWWSPTTAAASSTPPSPPPTPSPRSPPRSATGSRSTSTAASAAAPTSSRPSPWAPAPSWSAAWSSGAWRSRIRRGRAGPLRSHRRAPPRHGPLRRRRHGSPHPRPARRPLPLAAPGGCHTLRLACHR